MAGLKESSAGGFSMALKHGSIDTNASENGMFITVTIFDEQALGEKGFITAYLQGNWDDFYNTFKTVNEEVIRTKVKTGSSDQPADGNALIRMGKMKGRTVKAALEEFGREEVESHLRYIEGVEAQNPGKYKANAALIADIKAVLHQNAHESAETQKASSYNLWSENQWKSSPSIKNAEGLPLCTRLQIVATPGTETPFYISIEQGYAPVRPLENGLMAIELSKMDETTKRSANIFVTRKDFVNAVEEANRRFKVYREMKAADLNAKQMEARYSRAS